MNVNIITPPTSEPVTLDEAKSHLRVEVPDDDLLIGALIMAAREEVERRTWHSLMTQTLEVVYDFWPLKRYIELPRPPLQSVTSVIYRDANNTPTTWDAGDYLVAADQIPGKVVPQWGKHWPSLTLAPVSGITIRFVAGWSNAANVPKLLKQAMLLLIGLWYENREEGSAARAWRELPFGVDAILSSFRKRAYITDPGATTDPSMRWFV